MGTYVNNSVVSLGSEYDYDDAVREIASLINIGPREDGMYYLADICQANGINRCAKNKPVRHASTGPLLDSQRKAVNYGIEWPYLLLSAIWSADEDSRILKYLKPRGLADGTHADEWNRIRDFDGYNHLAGFYDITIHVDPTYVGRSVSGYALVYEANVQELKLSDFSLKVTTQASAPTVALSEWNLMFLMELAGAYYICNTGKTLAANIGLRIDLSLTPPSNIKKGDTLRIITCLAYDSSIPTGTTSVKPFEGDYSYTRFVPFNLSTDLEGEITKTFVEFAYFTSFGIIHGTVTPPASGKNYYSIANYFVFNCTGPFKTTNLFQLTYYIKRGTQTIAPTTGSNVKEVTFTFVENPAGSGNYVYDMGATTIQPITTVQSGDELWVDVKVQDNSNFHLVYSKKIYTHA